MKSDLMQSIEYLSKRVNKVLLILDTCQAEALFDYDVFANCNQNDESFEIFKNVKVVTTSLINQYSYSTTLCTILGVSTVDDFPKVFLQSKLRKRYLKQEKKNFDRLLSWSCGKHTQNMLKNRPTKNFLNLRSLSLKIQKMFETTTTIDSFFDPINFDLRSSTLRINKSKGIDFYMEDFFTDTKKVAKVQKFRI